VEEYDLCQRMKNRIEALVGKLMTNKILEKLWMHLTVDFIMKLLLVVGKYMILVVCNRLPKIAYFVAMIEETLIEGLARLFRDNVWKLYRLPKSIISDRESQFMAELTKELNKMLGIEMRLSIVFYSQTDRQTKQINQELEQYLRFFMEYKQRDWLEWLAIVVNNKIYAATKVLPFMENYRRELRVKVDIRRKGKVEK